jgi:hypothetical protein
MRLLQTALVLLSTACGSNPPPPEPRAEREQESAPEPSRVECRPLVSGCGCAYQCATGIEALADGRWRVIHDGLDSVAIEAVSQEWCFDRRGVGARVDATDGLPADRTCLEVFHDNTPCGGECIPMTEYLGCHAEGDRCVL